MLFVLWFIVVVVVSGVPYTIVRLATNNTAYLVLNDITRRIDDEATIISLGFKTDSLGSISPETLQARTVGEPILLIKANDQSADEIMRIEILKSHAVMGNLVKNIEYIGAYTNPSVVKWLGRMILVTGSNNGRANTKITKQALIEFKWLNTTQHRHSFHSSDKYAGIPVTEVEMLDKEVFGEDPRIVVLARDRLQIFYVYPFLPQTRIGMMEVAINYTSKEAYVVKFYSNIYPVAQANERHKNWTPFVHHSNGVEEVFVVQQINPLIVVHPRIHPDDGFMHADVISTAGLSDIDWPYGVIRGGTNAVLIKERGEYLAFFHSKGLIAGSSMNTYLMGAFSFSATVPFRLMAVSAMPIMPEQFYSGAWFNRPTTRIDYCFFPMSIFVESGEIVMSAGHQDGGGYLMRLNLKNVLDTMVPIMPVETK